MLNCIDSTDVHAIDKRDLALALRLLLAGGRVLASAHSLTEDEIRRVEQAFWQRAPKATRQTKVAVLVRLRSLVSVFSTRRMQILLARHGSGLVPPALAVAATMRLNASWGFSPQKFALALEEMLANDAQAIAA